MGSGLPKVATGASVPQLADVVADVTGAVVVSVPLLASKLVAGVASAPTVASKAGDETLAGAFCVAATFLGRSLLLATLRQVVRPRLCRYL